MTKLAPEWVRTTDPVIRSPARYRWTTAPAPAPWCVEYQIIKKMKKSISTVMLAGFGCGYLDVLGVVSPVSYGS